MNTCHSCGKPKNSDTNFCRYCGARLAQESPPAYSNPYDHPAPKPYSWKTDEYTTNTEARRTMPTGLSLPTGVEPSGHVHAPLAQVGPQHFAQAFRCPACMSSYPPRTERRISTGGWITFAALLVFFFPLFWIGLLIKEDVLVCQTCNAKLSA